MHNLNGRIGCLDEPPSAKAKLMIESVNETLGDPIMELTGVLFYKHNNKRKQTNFHHKDSETRKWRSEIVNLFGIFYGN